MASKSAASMFVDIFTAPRQALASLRETPMVWFPLLLLIGGWIALWYWYFSTVDYAWLVEHMIATETAKAPADQAAAIRSGIEQLTPGALVIVLSLVVIVLLLLVTLLTSVYLVVVSAVVDDQYRFKHWFSLAVWANIPSLLAMLAMVLNFMLSSHSRIPPEALNPLSFRNFLGLDASHPLSTMLDSLDLTSLWTWALLVLGYHTWTGRGWGASIAIVLAPMVTIYGLWAAWAWL